jgi:AAA+ superfamily predicted ATPase
MARSDLLISLVKSGRHSPDPRFRSTVEAIIAEERAKQHTALADQLSVALVNGSQMQALTSNQAVGSAPVLGDLLYEVSADRPLSDLILPKIVAEECRQLIEEHQRKDLLQSYGLAPRHRVLLVGPPGNGKTSVAHAVARELMVPLLVVRYEGLIASYLGETAARVRRLFDYARQRACVLFLDEFDTIAKERGDVHETGEIKRVVSTLLLQMDQLPPHVVVVTATNHAELLDRAVWRRFELRLTLPPPTAQQAKQFLRQLFKGMEGGEEVNVGDVARQVAGATYAEIEDLFRDVARRSILLGPGASVPAVVRDRLVAWKQRVGPTHSVPRRRP